MLSNDLKARLQAVTKWRTYPAFILSRGISDRCEWTGRKQKGLFIHIMLTILFPDHGGSDNGCGCDLRSGGYLGMHLKFNARLCFLILGDY